MLRPKPASRPLERQKRLILNVFEVINQPKRRIKISKILKKISLLRIFLLILYYHHQARPNLHQDSQPRKTRIVVFSKENLIIKAKAKAITHLLLALMLELSRIIKIKKSQLTLSAIIVSRRVTKLINILTKSQKTSVSIDDIHNSD